MTIHPFHAREDSHRPGSAWRHLLDQANSEAEVVSRVRDFIASFTPYEIESLPARARPGKIVDGADICGLAIDLRRARESAVGDSPVVGAFAEIFAYASQRLSRIVAGRSGTDRESA